MQHPIMQQEQSSSIPPQRYNYSSQQPRYPQHGPPRTQHTNNEKTYGESEFDNIMHPPIQTTATLGDGRTNIMVNGIVELSVTINDITTVITVLIVASLGAKLVL
ncbi:unnamed protein product, partial [Didymodactylos carnosus]